MPWRSGRNDNSAPLQHRATDKNARSREWLDLDFLLVKPMRRTPLETECPPDEAPVAIICLAAKRSKTRRSSASLIFPSALALTCPHRNDRANAAERRRLDLRIRTSRTREGYQRRELNDPTIFHQRVPHSFAPVRPPVDEKMDRSRGQSARCLPYPFAENGPRREYC